MVGVPPESEIGFTNYINMIIYITYLEEGHCKEEKIRILAELIE